MMVKRSSQTLEIKVSDLQLAVGVGSQESPAELELQQTA
jgi:hypothetical protein